MSKSTIKKLFLDIKGLFESQMSINRCLLYRIFALENRVNELEKILHDKDLKNE